MPSMRTDNVEPVLKREYLVCDIRPNKPQLNHLICEARCKKRKKCPQYSKWYYEYYGKEIEQPKKRVRNVRRK